QVFNKAGEYVRSGMLDPEDMSYVANWTERAKERFKKGGGLGDIPDPSVELANLVNAKPFKDLTLQKLYTDINASQYKYSSFNPGEALASLNSSYPPGSDQWKVLDNQLTKQNVFSPDMTEKQKRELLVVNAETKFRKEQRAPWRGTPTTQPYTIPFVQGSNGMYEADFGLDAAKHITVINGKPRTGYVFGVLYNPATGEKTMKFTYNEKVPDPNSFDVINPGMIQDSKVITIPYIANIENNLSNGRARLDWGTISAYKPQPGGSTEKKTKKTATDYNL
ncbi:MAG: hypothetical protein PHS93_09450, partial [Candidatus Omnitrophica bacterium]|nr:hypothetical protein [Candidatus Omnitrophota bacterium]